MDNQRLFLYGGLGLLILLVWQTWQVDYGPSAPSPQAERSAETEPPASEDLPGAPLERQQADAPADTSSDTPAAPAVGATLERARRVHVVTDVLDVTIDTRGGDVRGARLRAYTAESGSQRPVELLSDRNGDLFVAQSGLQAGDAPAPTHHAQFTAERGEYRLAEGQQSVRVPLTWEGDGVRVTKTFEFHRERYVADVTFRVENTSDRAWVGRQYHQLQRRPLTEGSRYSLLPTFAGAAYYSEDEKYEKVPFDDIAEEPLNKTVEGGWVAQVEHYFLAAWVPGADQRNTFYTKSLDDGGDRSRFLIGLYSPAESVAPGATGEFSTRLYVGPKVADELNPVATGLALTIDYGYLGFVSKWLFVVLDWIHDYVGNWGWAIVLLTLLIKLVFYKLSETSYRSMAKMRKLQPKIQQLKERYGDDREKMGRAMMDLYKTEKINPLGGCLPILVQIPVFIALYWMLLGSVELRHADFMLWIDDLSARDPYYVMPLLMGASMWFQQKLNPAPVDPLQQKIFTALPIVFTVFFAFFPSGLVLYWLTNNVLSIAQQYYITHHVVGDGKQPAKSES